MNLQTTSFDKRRWRPRMYSYKFIVINSKIKQSVPLRLSLEMKIDIDDDHHSMSTYKIISRRKMIFGWPLSCLRTRISRICWISSILKKKWSQVLQRISLSIRTNLLYNCFIFFAAQKVPSRIFWHLRTSENVPSPFFPSIRYSDQSGQKR